MVGALRVIFFGTPEFAVPTLRSLLDSRHEVVAVVSQPDRPRGRGHRLTPTPTRTLAHDRGVPVLQPERIRTDAFLSDVRALHPDLGVVAAYGKILPDALLAIPRLGMINVHASLLPAYRGAAPVHRAVIAGERETGVTIMRVVQALDAGPMLATLRHPVGPDDTSVAVERALAELGAPLLLEVVGLLAEGRATETPQDDARATYAPKITREDGIVDWSRPALAIHNQVRGVQPWPLASVAIDNVRYLLHRTQVGTEPLAIPPGTIARASGDRLEIAAGDGRPLRILEIQPEGRRVMGAREFLAGHRFAPGTRAGQP
jgi:methionyl-tRNA formyltransferase